MNVLTYTKARQIIDEVEAHFSKFEQYIKSPDKDHRESRDSLKKHSLLITYIHSTLDQATLTLSRKNAVAHFPLEKPNNYDPVMSRAVAVGDLHASWLSFQLALYAAFEGSENYVSRPRNNIGGGKIPMLYFLGDFVDRGGYELAFLGGTRISIALAKFAEFENVIIQAGNHETYPHLWGACDDVRHLTNVRGFKIRSSKVNLGNEIDLICGKNHVPSTSTANQINFAQNPGLAQRLRKRFEIFFEQLPLVGAMELPENVHLLPVEYLSNWYKNNATPDDVNDIEKLSDTNNKPNYANDNKPSSSNTKPANNSNTTNASIATKYVNHGSSSSSSSNMQTENQNDIVFL